MNNNHNNTQNQIIEPIIESNGVDITDTMKLNLTPVEAAILGNKNFFIGVQNMKADTILMISDQFINSIFLNAAETLDIEGDSGIRTPMDRFKQVLQTHLSIGNIEFRRAQRIMELRLKGFYQYYDNQIKAMYDKVSDINPEIYQVAQSMCLRLIGLYDPLFIKRETFSGIES